MLHSWLGLCLAGVAAAMPPQTTSRQALRTRGQRGQSVPVRVVRNHTEGVTTGEAPPGMILIPGGSFRMGVPMAEALALAAGDRRNYADRIVAIAPDHAEAVSSFFLDRGEVTSEQFRRWLDAAHLPPSKGLVDLAWNKVERGTRVEGIPPGEELLPVRAVSFDEAKRAARFAGKRLPTEVEWEHAARRRLAPGSWYPWGQGWKAWDARRCANFESTSRSNRGPAPQVAGSFPADVSTDGVLDLCGNVAEWTDATFDPYPGFVAPVIDDRGRKWRASPPFSSLQRVVRGGSAYGNEVTNNLVMRVGEFPGTVLEGVGFRGALSALP